MVKSLGADGDATSTVKGKTMTEVEKLLGEILNAEKVKRRELKRRKIGVTQVELEDIVREVAYLDEQIWLRQARILQLTGIGHDK